ncbi:MAG: hypothetical protein AAF927_28795 [Bacteroidota bacterium]
MKKRNAKGVIADSYHELQSLDTIFGARNSRIFTDEDPSIDSAIITLLQAAEIVLNNLNDLTKRAGKDLKENKINKLSSKIKWIKSFNLLLLHITSAIENLSSYNRLLGANNQISVYASPSIHQYKSAYISLEKGFDYWVFDLNNEAKLDQFLYEKKNKKSSQIIKDFRDYSFWTKKWEKNLATIYLNIDGNYQELVQNQILELGVKKIELSGDTYFKQFRGLHQVPEIVTSEINRLLEITISNIEEDTVNQVPFFLGIALKLSNIVLSSLDPLVDNMTAQDYHKIRENLGLTSGSHSVNIHFHLFRDLYRGLGKVFSKKIAQPSNSEELEVARLLLEFRSFTFAWREKHIQLPRNNLGGGNTKSLIGANDAIRTTRKMYHSAVKDDPLDYLVDHKAFLDNIENLPASLSFHINSPDSLDSRLTNALGKITKKKFKEVQDREGKYAEKSTFMPPKRKRID